MNNEKINQSIENWIMRNVTFDWDEYKFKLEEHLYSDGSNIEKIHTSLKELILNSIEEPKTENQKRFIVLESAVIDVNEIEAIDSNRHPVNLRWLMKTKKDYNITLTDDDAKEVISKLKELGLVL